MNFVKTSDCAKLGNFDRQLDGEIDLVYQNLGDTNKRLTSLPNVPSKVTAVCFGSLNQNAEGANKEKQDYFIKNRVRSTDNLFYYPLQQSCDRKYSSFSLNHITTSNFFCLPVKNGKVDLRIAKSSTDASVTLCGANQTNCIIGSGSSAQTNYVQTNPSIQQQNINTTNAATNNANRDICARAQQDNLCQGLNIAYDSLLKQKCCSDYNLCCTS